MLSVPFIIENLKAYIVTEQSVNYVDATIQDEKVAEFLIDQFVYNFVDNNGLDEADGLIVLFRKHVKDAKSIEKFNALCTRVGKIKIRQSLSS